MDVSLAMRAGVLFSNGTEEPRIRNINAHTNENTNTNKKETFCLFSGPQTKKEDDGKGCPFFLG